MVNTQSRDCDEMEEMRYVLELKRHKVKKKADVQQKKNY